MSWPGACIAWLRRALGLAERRTFASLLDEAIEKPFVSFSARALEQAMLLEGPADTRNENPNPEQSAHADAKR